MRQVCRYGFVFMFAIILSSTILAQDTDTILTSENADQIKVLGSLSYDQINEFLWSGDGQYIAVNHVSGASIYHYIDNEITLIAELPGTFAKMFNSLGKEVVLIGDPEIVGFPKGDAVYERGANYSIYIYNFEIGEYTHSHLLVDQSPELSTDVLHVATNTVEEEPVHFYTDEEIKLITDKDTDSIREIIISGFALWDLTDAPLQLYKPPLISIKPFYDPTRPEASYCRLYDEIAIGACWDQGMSIGLGDSDSYGGSFAEFPILDIYDTTTEELLYRIPNTSLPSSQVENGYILQKVFSHAVNDYRAREILAIDNEVWAARTGEILYRFPDPIIAYSYDGRYAATASNPNYVTVWDIDTNLTLKSVEMLMPFKQVEFVPQLNTDSPSVLLTILDENSRLTIWDVITAAPKWGLLHNSGNESGYRFTKDGLALAAEDGTAWNLLTGEMSFDTDTSQLAEEYILRSDATYFEGGSIESNQGYHATYLGTNTVALIDTTTGDELSTISFPEATSPVVFPGYSAENPVNVNGPWFSPLGSWMAFNVFLGSNTTELWLYDMIDGPEEPYLFQKIQLQGRSYHLEFTQDEKNFLITEMVYDTSGNYTDLYLSYYETDTGVRRWNIDNYGGAFVQFPASNNAAYFLRDMSLGIVNLSTGLVEKEIPTELSKIGGETFIYSASSNELLVLYNYTSIEVINIENSASSVKLQPPLSFVVGDDGLADIRAAFTPNKQLLIVQYNYDYYDVNIKPALFLVIWDTASWSPIKTINDVESFTISPIGDLLALGYKSGQLELWGIEEQTRTFLHSGPLPFVNNLDAEDLNVTIDTAKDLTLLTYDSIGQPIVYAPTCQGVPESRLELGDYKRAFVDSETPLTLSAVPGSQSPSIMTVAGGMPVILLGGPVCLESKTYWLLGYASDVTDEEKQYGLSRITDIGWGAETDNNGNYLLVPEEMYVSPLAQMDESSGNATLQPNSSVPSSCPGAPQIRLKLGENARVTPGISINLRAEPSASANLIDRAREGSVLSIVDGPTCSENLTWWYVNYNNSSGWVAEGDDDSYWLEPIASTVANTLSEDTCVIIVSEEVKVRTGPGTNFDEAGRLYPGDSSEVIGYALNASGFKWWKLSNNTWVREDVVAIEGNCSQITEVQI